jgi:hypothetical protein
MMSTPLSVGTRSVVSPWQTEQVKIPDDVIASYDDLRFLAVLEGAVVVGDFEVSFIASLSVENWVELFEYRTPRLDPGGVFCMFCG